MIGKHGGIDELAAPAAIVRDDKGVAAVVAATTKVGSDEVVDAVVALVVTTDVGSDDLVVAVREVRSEEFVVAKRDVRNDELVVGRIDVEDDRAPELETLSSISLLLEGDVPLRNETLRSAGNCRSFRKTRGADGRLEKFVQGVWTVGAKEAV